jgi:hypothetical protein
MINVVHAPCGMALHFFLTIRRLCSGPHGIVRSPFIRTRQNAGVTQSLLVSRDLRRSQLAPRLSDAP